jgi:hypothetical protein
MARVTLDLQDMRAVVNTFLERSVDAEAIED